MYTGFTTLSGQWSKEEEEELTKIVTDLTLKQGRDADNDVFWGVVSQRMCGKRSRQQCRIKWSVYFLRLLYCPCLKFLEGPTV